jgi:hypothetical protein
LEDLVRKIGVIQRNASADIACEVATVAMSVDMVVIALTASASVDVSSAVRRVDPGSGHSIFVVLSSTELRRTAWTM